MPNFAGRWHSTFGPLELSQQGSRVSGTYGGNSTLSGTIQENRLVFRYEEPRAGGEGWFELKRAGKFVGQWRPDGAEGWGPWSGERGFDGVWQTSFGPMRLFQHADRIHGFYEGVSPPGLEGRLQEERFVFNYQEPKARGEGWFALSEDHELLEGAWRPEGGAGWGEWRGRRVHADPGRRWLVVLEAHWQKSLAEEEYSFGHMLREFFARVGQVSVRHRFFQNEAGLEKWCRELMYLVEPTVLAVATHGTHEGLVAHGQPIAPRVLVENLVWAENLVLLHFSACLMLEESPAGELARRLQRLGRFPVSGYTTAVDWAASAILEYTYFDLILSRGLDPADAAQNLPRLLSFAAAGGCPELGYPGAGFRFLPRLGAGE
jgi:hypothetical protein